MEGKISAASKQPLERVPRYKAISQKSSVEGEAAAKWINWSTSKTRGREGRCDEPSGSEHLSRCVIPLDESFHHHLRRAFRGAERGSELARPKAPSNKAQARGVGTENSKKIK